MKGSVDSKIVQCVCVWGGGGGSRVSMVSHWAAGLGWGPSSKAHHRAPPSPWEVPQSQYLQRTEQWESLI